MLEGVDVININFTFNCPKCGGQEWRYNEERDVRPVYNPAGVADSFAIGTTAKYFECQLCGARVIRRPNHE